MTGHTLHEPARHSTADRAAEGKDGRQEPQATTGIMKHRVPAHVPAKEIKCDRRIHLLIYMKAEEGINHRWDKQETTSETADLKSPSPHYV